MSKESTTKEDIATTVDASSKKRQDYLEWDDYFMATAVLSAKRSKDPVTQVGACIVDKVKRIVAVGYNGFPRNCSDDVFSWGKNSAIDPLDDKNMYVVHAEANAILNSHNARLEGTRLYTTLFPCNECTKLIIQSGIKEIFYMTDKYAEKPTYQASKRMLDAVGITYHKHVPLQKRIVIDFDLIQDAPKTPKDIKEADCDLSKQFSEILKTD